MASVSQLTSTVFFWRLEEDLGSSLHLLARSSFIQRFSNRIWERCPNLHEAPFLSSDVYQTQSSKNTEDSGKPPQRYVTYSSTQLQKLLSCHFECSINAESLTWSQLLYVTVIRKAQRKGLGFVYFVSILGRWNCNLLIFRGKWNNKKKQTGRKGRLRTDGRLPRRWWRMGSGTQIEEEFFPLKGVWWR